MHQKKADVEVGVLISALVIGGKGEVSWSRCQSFIDFHLALLFAPSDIVQYPSMFRRSPKVRSLCCSVDVEYVCSEVSWLNRASLIDYHTPIPMFYSSLFLVTRP